MAGDWIPITTDLATRREVLLIAEATGTSRHEVVGILAAFWGWASHETEDGCLRDISVATVCATLSLQTNIIRAMVDVGWLLETPTGLVVCNWERWLSNSAKARLGNALRQKLYRAKRNESVATSVATKVLPEKRREEKSNTPYSPPFETFWKAVRPAKRGRKLEASRAYQRAVDRLKGIHPDPDAFLRGRALAYYASPLGQTQYANGAAPFLNQGVYDDDPAAWQRDDRRNTDRPPEPETPLLE